jgi:hypothetical protein
MHRRKSANDSPSTGTPPPAEAPASRSVTRASASSGDEIVEHMFED